MCASRWCIALALVLGIGGLIYAEEKADAGKGKSAAGLLCPVSGKPAGLANKTMTPEGPVFFCCDGCPKKFEADADKYKEQVAAQRAVLAHYPKVQETCPLSGKPIIKEAFVESEGKKVYFCCNGCAGKYKAEPAKFKDKLAATYTYLDLPKCPISGKPADLSIKVMSDDGAVYFCCNGCPKKYSADAAKYKEQVAEQRKALAAMDRVQVTCPLSGKPVDVKQFTDKGGEKVYFCCEHCKEGYEKDPAKHAAKLSGSYAYQTLCPVSGEEISPKAFLELADGRKVYFCCSDCKGKMTANPAKYVASLQMQHIQIDADKLKAEK